MKFLLILTLMCSPGIEIKWYGKACQECIETESGIRVCKHHKSCPYEKEVVREPDDNRDKRRQKKPE
jgi:hypothetical protein